MSAAQATKPERWWRYVHKRRIECADGHHIRETANIPEHGFLRCSQWIGSEKRECSRWVFVLAIRGGGVILAEVQLAEIRAIEQEELTTPAAVLEYLIGGPASRIALAGTSVPPA